MDTLHNSICIVSFDSELSNVQNKFSSDIQTVSKLKWGVIRGVVVGCNVWGCGV